MGMGVAIEDLVGLSAGQSLALLLASMPDVKEIKLAELHPSATIQNRLSLSDSERVVFDRAIEVRQNTGLPFWDSLLLVLPEFPDALRFLDTALTHVSLRGHEFSLSIAEVSRGGIERACAKYVSPAGPSLTLLSQVVRTDGSPGHLPMLDFHARKSTSNQRIVEAVAQRLFPHGSILIDSGESYHAYGKQLIPPEDFGRFIGTALLFAPITDRAYLAHQLIEGQCALRLTAGGGKSQVPRVVGQSSER